MARRSARRTYVRDGRGRFASTGTTTAKAKPAARRAQRGTNRITRDNSGKITGVGKNGATARGGRLRTAAGNQRGAVLDRLKRAPMAGTVGRGGKVRGGVKPVARPATPAKPARATVNGASQAKARLQRAMDNYNKKKYAVVQAEARLKKAKSPKASKALGKANKSLMTASQAVKYLKGNMNSDTLRMGSRYRAGNRDNVAATYSVKRVAGAFRPGKSRLVAPPKGTRMGRAIPGSGGQVKATAKAPRPSGTIRKPQGLKPGALAQKAGAKGGKGSSGVKAIPKGELKRYRMLQNKIGPLRKRLDADGSTMIGSADRQRVSKASARYSQNLRKLRRITDTLRRLSNSPDTPNIPRLPFVASVGARLGRTAAIKRMDGSRKFGGQSWRDLRGQYQDGRVQYEDNYMNKLYNRKNKGSTVKGPKLAGVVRKAAAKPAPKPAPKLLTGRTVYRTRAQAIRAQRARTNALGKATAAKRGFNEVSAANFRARIAGQRGNQQMFADSAPRTVISRPRIPQLSLSGRVERVGAGRFRTVGERLGGGSIRRSRSKPGPLRGTKAWKRQLEQAIKANGGKDVAAFRF